MSTLLITILTLGCTLPDPDPGQSGEEMMSCTAASTQDYALADTTPLGFTGQQLADLVVGSHAATLTWAKGGDTALTVDVTSAATVVTWRDMEWQDDGSGAEIATMESMDCADDLVLAATVGFTTADGAFAESWDLDLAAQTADTAAAYSELDLDNLTGTYTVTEVDPADYDAVRAFLDLSFDAAGVSGAIQGQAEKADAETASATNVDIATFQ